MSSPVSKTPGRTSIFAQRCAEDARRYFERHGCSDLPELPAADPDLGMVIVIPALAEPDLVATAASVAAAARPRCAVELLLVINAADDAGADARRVTEQSLADATAWAAGSHHGRFGCHVLDHRDLPARQAGVGLARKLGMDTGLARLAASASGRGIIVSLDADCRVASNYLTAVYDRFCDEPDALGATICFEHPLAETPPQLRAAIVEYELHLRCYRHGLRAAGSAYAHYNVGSAFAVRSEIYAQEGGMNRRRAGEDFYFINKLLKRGRVAEIGNTTVYPSARVSERVPFGTGAAMRLAAGRPATTSAPAVYPALRRLLLSLDAAVRAERPPPPEYAPFLATMGFDGWLANTRANVASVATLETHLRRWLDGFRTLKFVHWLTESGHPRVPVVTAAREIAGWRGLEPAGGAIDLLRRFRELDRGGTGAT